MPTALRGMGQVWRLRETRLFGTILWVAGGQVAVALIGLVALRVLTGLVSPAVFGEANLLMTAMTLGMNVLVAPIQNTQLRYHTRFLEGGRDAAFSAAMLSRALLAAALVAVLALCASLGWDHFAHRQPRFLLAGVLVFWAPLFAIRNTLVNRLFAERRQDVQAVWQGSEAAAVLAATAALVLLRPSTDSYLAGQLAGMAAVAAIFYYALVQLRRFQFGREGRSVYPEADRLIRSYGLPFAGLAVLNWAGNLADRYILGLELDAAAVGYYVAAFAIASRAMLMSGGVVSDAFRPALFEAENAGDAVRARQLFRTWLGLVAVTSILVGGGLWLFASLVTNWLLAEAYRAQASSIMHWIALGYGLVVVNSVLDNRVLSFGASGKLFWPMALGAAANVGFSLLLIPTSGLTGAAQASAASFGVQVCATAFVLARLARQRRQPSAG